jgi:hypothetical protein
MYISHDVEGGFYRIPAIFTSAHAYGGTMVGTLPFLIGLWQRAKGRIVSLLALAGIAAAMLGVLLSATRLNFIVGSVIILATIVTTKMRARSRALFILIVAAAGLLALTNTRLQRFKSLSDSEGVAERISGSVNRTFLEILFEYPMGNGLGGGGTSMPYFLSNQVRNPIGLENDYARILAEQGWIGFMLWLGFIFWFLTRFRCAFSPGIWPNSRRIAWCVCSFWLGTAWIGVGAFTAIPNTALLLLAAAWAATPQPWQQTARRFQTGAALLQKPLHVSRVTPV